jgi:large subunit ribosomal protein L23
MMDHTQIIKRPLVTEKCTWEGAQRNRFSFVVDGKAKKPQIKLAVEELFKVRVLKVSTQTRKGKYRRTRFGQAKTSDWKKATVHLHEDDKIDIF